MRLNAWTHQHHCRYSIFFIPIPPLPQLWIELFSFCRQVLFKFIGTFVKAYILLYFSDYKIVCSLFDEIIYKSINWVSFAQMSFLNDVSPVKNLIIYNFNLPKEDKFFLRD